MKMISKRNMNPKRKTTVEASPFVAKLLLTRLSHIAVVYVAWHDTHFQGPPVNSCNRYYFSMFLQEKT